MNIPAVTDADADHNRDRLSFAGQFLLWSVRIWVTGYHQQWPAASHIDHAFRVLEADDGGQVLNRLMAALGSGARRPIDIRPPCYRELSADERRVLDVVRYIQAGDETGGLFILSALIKPSARTLVLPLFRQLAAVLLSAGLDLTTRGNRKALPTPGGAAAGETAGAEPPNHPAAIGRYDS